ncbi:MAG: hypothetical protein WCG45_00370 [bacterium]
MKLQSLLEEFYNCKILNKTLSEGLCLELRSLMDPNVVYPIKNNFGISLIDEKILVLKIEEKTKYSDKLFIKKGSRFPNGVKREVRGTFIPLHSSFVGQICPEDNKFFVFNN